MVKDAPGASIGLRQHLFRAQHRTKEPDPCELRSHMSSARLTNLTVVVVEDHDDARRYLSVFLDRLGANVVAVRNGFEGLGWLFFTALLSDIAMPETDGFELLREIRALGAAPAARVPASPCLPFSPTLIARPLASRHACRSPSLQKG